MKRLFRSVIAVVLALFMLLSTASALTVEEALGLLEESYLREIPEEAYEAESLEELFQILGDPHTFYMNEEEYQWFIESVENTVNLVGIGVSIQYTAEGILVVEPLKGGPALEAGLRSGDLIVAIDGVSCVPAVETHRDLILGEEGSEVVITVARDGVQTDYTLKRAAVVIPNTEMEVLDGHIGYISCSSFGSETGNLFLEYVQSANESVDCWLVDVRGNSGGLSDAAVDAIGVLAGAGPHLYLRDRQGRFYYYFYNQEQATEHQTVVLVNEHTASAAEAFAAGIRDLRAGLTIGTRTYGKGTAQIIVDGENNPDLFENDALKLTAYRFYSNGWITNDQVGVIPTLVVPGELAYDVGLAICGTSDIELENQLIFRVDSWVITVDYAAMRKEALSALLEAIPPAAGLWMYEDGQEISVTVAEAAQRAGVEYHSRWFRDAEDSQYADAINTLATYDIIHGDGEGNFYPNESLTRGEACAMLGKALGLDGSMTQRFEDLSPEDANTPYINAMAEMGLVVGNGAGLFLPDDPVTQQEYYIMLARAAMYLNVNFEFMGDDITEDQMEWAKESGFRLWARKSATLLDMMGVLPIEEGLLPAQPILRETAAVSLYGVLVKTGVLSG